MAAVVALAAILYLLPIPQRGLVGPDEPRYASISRQMAESGDWITPTLWGEPWFEKPALLFWMGGLGYLAGIEPHTRVPVALLSLGFLLFLYRTVRDEFDKPTAIAAACILGTSGGWVACSDAGIFDLPVAAFTGAALLCLLPWIRAPELEDARRRLPAFGALLGLSVLSKGLVGPIIAFLAVVPALVSRPRRALELLGPRTLVPFLVVCLPWYLACYLRNGQVFVDEFLVRHHWERFFNESLQHQQPIWFFLPVLLAFALPWTPLLCSLRGAALWEDPRLRFLSAWTVLPVAFFSLSVNKLPAYILPVLPPLAILLAVQWQRSAKRSHLVAAAATLFLVPIAGALLPRALADGITRAWADASSADIGRGLAAGLVACGLACIGALKVRRDWAVPTVGIVAVLSLTLLKFEAYPAISEVAGTRELAERHATRIPEACLGDLRRHVAYGLRHYLGDTIPLCEAEPRKFRIEGDPPQIVSNPTALRGGRAYTPATESDASNFRRNTHTASPALPSQG